MGRNALVCITVIIVSAICCNSGFAQNPVEIAAKAFSCFNDKYIYSSCNEEYQLNQRGYINVPPAATDQFCYGPCLAETHLVLDCVDHSLSNFVFYNKATTNDIRATLQTACGHTSHRGNFNVEEYMQNYMQDEWSSANLPPQPNKLFTTILAVFVLFLIFREAI